MASRLNITHRGVGSSNITLAEASAMGLTAENIWQGEQRLELEIEPYGWHRLQSIAGLCISAGGTVYGKRRLLNMQESGYQMTGRVSIDGCKVRAFTGSHLFALPEVRNQYGKPHLVNVEVIIACSEPYARNEWHCERTWRCECIPS